ncbi:MAG: ATP-binding protein [Zetaproteobacteria bacterium]|nr:ATP-binding protein [Zetaproteobacteria bacterium]
MPPKIWTASTDALNTQVLEVESTFLRGFAGIQLIGNVTDICKAGMERAKASLENCGLILPQKKIMMSVTPASARIDGSQIDLAFAASLASLTLEQTSSHALNGWVCVAELDLEGNLRPVKNIVSFLLAASATPGCHGIILSEANLKEANALASLNSPLLSQLQVVGLHNLTQLLDWLTGAQVPVIQTMTDLPHIENTSVPPLNEPNFDDMVLSDQMRTLALTIASGHHSLMLYGTPGTGKSMFACRLPSLFCKLDEETHIQALRIHSSLAEHIDPNLLAAQPPFRNPHHQTSAGAILGVPEAPGEISLAHGGLLFLDEIPEFRRDILESLREPLETGVVQVSRARRKVTWEGRTILIAACNLCPCGWLGSKKRRCTCPTQKILSYRRKISGPILDRIDLHYNLFETVKSGADLLRQITAPEHQGATAQMRQRVQQARDFAQTKYMLRGTSRNAHINPKQLAQACGLTSESLAQKVEAVIPNHASPRSTIRCIRVARTLADLNQQEQVQLEDLQLAWQWQAEPCGRSRGDQALGLL